MKLSEKVISLLEETDYKKEPIDESITNFMLQRNNMNMLKQIAKSKSPSAIGWEQLSLIGLGVVAPFAIAVIARLGWEKFKAIAESDKKLKDFLANDPSAEKIKDAISKYKKSLELENYKDKKKGWFSKVFSKFSDLLDRTFSAYSYAPDSKVYKEMIKKLGKELKKKESETDKKDFGDLVVEALNETN